MGVKEMSKRYILRSSQCLSTHDNEVGRWMFLKVVSSVVSGCCNDDRFLKKSTHILSCSMFLKVGACLTISNESTLSARYPHIDSSR